MFSFDSKVGRGDLFFFPCSCAYCFSLCLASSSTRSRSSTWWPRRTPSKSWSTPSATPPSVKIPLVLALYIFFLSCLLFVLPALFFQWIVFSFLKILLKIDGWIFPPSLRKQGGNVKRQSVDVAPFRRVNVAICMLCQGARQSAFRNIKSISECLADEIINASKKSTNSFAFKKKEEVERVAKSNR